MLPEELRRWDVTIPEAKRIQERLRERVRVTKFGKTPRTIAGADVSFIKYDDRLYATFLVFSFPDLVEIDRASAETIVKFPYVPGFLSFREIPALLSAYEKLKIKPDIIMVDGQGIAHPRRLGIATHLGLVLDVPTIGCAKSLLFGKGEAPELSASSVSHIRDPKTDETIGAYVRTKDAVMPLIVSPGNGITLDESIRLVLDCTHGYRLPEPTRRAHIAVNEFRRLQQSSKESS